MSRLKRYAHSLASGYAAVIGNVVYSLLSVPIAIHYLTNEEFGLWLVAAQISAYLVLIDVGMSGSIARILIDHKDDLNGGTYGAVIKTGTLVLLLQGIIIGLLGVILGLWLTDLFDVPAKFLRQFRWLIGGQSAVLGLTFAGRIFSFILQAHQRYDVLNYAQLGSFAVNLLVLWLAFSLDLGVYSLLAASAAGLIFTPLCALISSARLGFIPAQGCWGRSSRALLREMFLFGLDLFLLFVGQQLVTTAQVLVVSKVLGFKAAAIWGVATKAFMLAQLVVTKLIEFSGSAFSEMFVRGERERLGARFRDVVILSASVSLVAGFAVASCNPAFLHFWTRDRIHWESANDFLMAVSGVVYALTRCFIGFIMVTKEIKALKYIFVLEGLCLIGLGLVGASHFGFLGVIASGILTGAFFSGAYGVRRIQTFLGITAREMIREWMKFPFRLGLVLAIASGVLWFLTHTLPYRPQLLINLTAVLLIGATSLWYAGLPQHMRREFRAMLERMFQRLVPAWAGRGHRPGQIDANHPKRPEKETSP